MVLPHLYFLRTVEQSSLGEEVAVLTPNTGRVCRVQLQKEGDAKLGLIEQRKFRQLHLFQIRLSSLRKYPERPTRTFAAFKKTLP